MALSTTPIWKLELPSTIQGCTSMEHSNIELENTRAKIKEQLRVMGSRSRGASIIES